MSQSEINLPHKINVMGQWVKIKYVKQISGEDAGTHGIFDAENNLIVIRKQNPNEMYKTLIHELGHALFAYSGLGEILGHKKEEATCRMLENFSQLFYLTGSPRFCRLRVNKRQVDT